MAEKYYLGDQTRVLSDTSEPSTEAAAAARVRAMLDDLAGLGITLAQPSYVDLLVDEYDADYLAGSGPAALLDAMGSPVDTLDDQVYYSDDVWSPDAEEPDEDEEEPDEDGPYPQVFRRLSAMAGGALDITDVRLVDGEVRLRLHGEERTFTPHRDEEWWCADALDWANAVLDAEGSATTFHVLDVGYGPAVVLTDDSTARRLGDMVRPRRARRSVDWRIGAVAAVVVVLGLSVFYVGMSKNTPLGRLERYLDAHLPVAVEYRGEVSSSGRTHVYRFASEDGITFRCIALSGDTAYMCTWTLAYAAAHGEEMVQALSPWPTDYESFTLSVTVSDEADLPLLADTLAAQLEAIRAPVLSDPDGVFYTLVEFTVDVVWAPPGAEPRPVASYAQPVGDEPAPGSAEILDQLQAAISQP